jgi:hypothetical protein
MGVAQRAAQPKKLLEKSGKHFVKRKARCIVV